ncbi:MAG: hypothetical protein KDB37_17155 [Ilumatobacter sp.]|nr:hypothetical protein [Ilumatobacter sp.]
MRAHDPADPTCRDPGAMAVLTLLVAVAITTAVLLALVPVVADLGDRQRAQHAADAAALAGVSGGRSAASTLASANGGALVSFTERGDDVVVVVRVGDHDATARATDGP